MFGTLRFILLISLCAPTAAWAQDLVREGILDLRGQNLNKPVETRGAWDFYWNDLIAPDGFARTTSKRSTINVPNGWTQAPEKYPAMGHATYRLTVLLDRAQPVAIYFPASIWSATRIFIEGQDVARFGRLGTSPETSYGAMRSLLYAFTPQSNRFEVIVQVANYEIFLAGITNAPSVGKLEALTLMRYQKISLDVFIIGALFIMGIYHLCLYSLRRSDPSTLFFGLMCLCVSGYLVVGRDGILMTLMPNLSLGARLRIYNITWMSSIPMFTWFAHCIFQKQYNRWVPIGTSIVTAAYILLFVSTSHRFFVAQTLVYQGLVVLLLLYSLVVIVRAALHQVEGALFFLAGALFLFAGATMDILSVQGYHQLPAMGGIGLFSFIFFQSYMIARKFSFAFKRVRISERAIRKLSDDLQREHQNVLTLNASLERRVEEKTRDIRSIMEHIPLGIFMIETNQQIHRDHSAHLKDIFLVPEEEMGKAVATDLLFGHSTLTSDARSQAISTLQSTLGESSLNFEVNAHTLPVEIVQDQAGRSRVFDITWNPIEGADELVDKMLVTMRDVTELRKLQERSRDQQEELEFIGEILNISSDRFLRFIQSCQTFIQENDKLIHSQSMQKQNLEVLKLLFINMHTIKGAARSLYFKKMTQVFHDVEQYYAVLQKDREVLWDVKRMERDLKEAARIVGIYEKIAREKLGRNHDHTRKVELPIDQVEDYYRRMAVWENRQELPAELVQVIKSVRRSFHDRIFKSAEEIFADILECVPVLARDLHKETPSIRLETSGFLLSEKAEEIFRRIFVHLLRNSMDHGIESGAERTAQGKKAQGAISIHMEPRGLTLGLRFHDDGRGLNLRRIEEIGRARGLLSSEHKPSRAEVAELIFDSGLSTANQVSDISGRGVGMDAVRRFIRDAGGEINLQLGQELKEGFHSFTFSIDLPLDLFEGANPPAGEAAA